VCNAGLLPFINAEAKKMMAIAVSSFMGLSFILLLSMLTIL